MPPVILDTPLAAFLDDLTSDQPTPGPEQALAVAGAEAASLVARAAQSAAAPDDALTREAETIRADLKGFLAHHGDGPIGSGAIEGILELGRRSTAIVDLATRTLGRQPRTAGTLPALAAAVALARAAAEGAVQQVTLHLGEIDDDLSRMTMKTKAEGLGQRVRQAEADFQQMLLIQGKT